MPYTPLTRLYTDLEEYLEKISSIDSKNDAMYYRKISVLIKKIPHARYLVQIAEDLNVDGEIVYQVVKKMKERRVIDVIGDNIRLC